jgi:ATP-dependent DNA helicase RecG
MENQTIEYKSIRKILNGDKGFKDLAVTCVAFANTPQGGIIQIGVEDKSYLPPAEQKIKQEQLNDTLEHLKGLAYSVGLSVSPILTAKNGGEYFEIRVHPSQKVIASTSDGKYYVRIADKCVPVHGEDLPYLIADKDAFQWELIEKQNVLIADITQENIARLVADIKQSDRVKDSVKMKSDVELLEHYNLIVDGHLTNLGILWLGTARQRARLSYPIIIQYIVYDAQEQKIRKFVWDDYSLNPKDLLSDIEKEAVELDYSYEIPDGLFRNKVQYYSREVVRELLVNAVAHKSYLISSDITIEVYPDRMCITSPGSLPLGITADNILHEKKRRNPHLVRLLHDLKLMEAEGSGYDLIYEKLSTDMKAFPVIESDYNKVSVTLYSQVLDMDALRLTDFISRHYQLGQREQIVVGIVARHHRIYSTELAKVLQLKVEDRLRTWTAGLIKNGILLSQGNKKGTTLLINPKLLSSSRLDIKPTLKTMEPYKLMALIEEDLRSYPKSKSSDIQRRIEEISIEEIRKCLRLMLQEGKIVSEGAKKGTVYILAKKN